MRLAVVGDDELFLELSQDSQGIEWVRAQSMEAIQNTGAIDGLFNLNDNAGELEYAEFAIPVFVNSVSAVAGKKSNLTRINGWKGFLQNKSWEIAGNHNGSVQTILEKLNKKVIVTTDVPGFISASVIAMIINEAYFAKADGVSTEAEIDLAMKLGTNYPYGPFEWAQKIGLKNILNLLTSMSDQNNKYAPSPLLVMAAKAS